MVIERLEAERSQVVAKLNAAEAAQRTAEIDLRRTSGLLEEGLASRREFEQADKRAREASRADAAGRSADAAGHTRAWSARGAWGA